MPRLKKCSNSNLLMVWNSRLSSRVAGTGPDHSPCTKKTDLEVVKLL